jgi:DNA (cytosine-5)-methyltransferase 1
MGEDMRVLDLFSGIGGFSLGLHRAGMETVAFCEFDEKCRKVLTKHWPDVPQYNDVRTLTAEQLKNDGINNIGLICGGYPCQPFSLAGKRDGQKDDRHLWPEIKRLLTEFIDRKEPIPICLFENVVGHVSMGLDSVLSDLESLGYSCQPIVIPACAVGAYHRRYRVWIVANINEPGLQERQQLAGVEKVETKAGARENFAFHTGREDRCTVGRGLSGLPGRVDRLKQLGNAVVPQVVEQIGRAIMEQEL